MDGRARPGHDDRGHHPAGRIILAFFFVLPLLAFVATALWLTWTLAAVVLGTAGAGSAILILLIGSFVGSQLVTRSFAGPVLVRASYVLAASLWIVFGLAGYALVSAG